MDRMQKINPNSPPRIAVVITDKVANAWIRKRHVDLLEERVDLYRRLDLGHIENIIRQRRKLGIPMILTVRNQKAEGGSRKITDKQKLAIFERIISLGDAVDVELSSPLLPELTHLAREKNKTCIISFHNFRLTPDDSSLERILHDAQKQKADIVKIAVKANTLGDVGRLIAFTVQNKAERIVTMSIGELGKVSRLVLPAVGSLWTYSFVGQPSAPGQVPLKILQEHFSFYYPSYSNTRL